MSSSSRSRSARPPGSTSAANNTACATGSTNSTSSHFSIIPTFTGDLTNPTGSPPPPPGQGGQGGLPQPGIQSSAQFARHEFFHLSLVLRLAALPSFFDLGRTIDTRMGMLSWYYARTVRTVYTFLLLGVPSAIVIATAA
ncbi:hypothetical protein B0H13DRAFT_1871679 [Mycena leptocephala]|nr:hypothetical protein B0H13DRAFT_1871679 [Mycena leptocephala]